MIGDLFQMTLSADTGEDLQGAIYTLEHTDAATLLLKAKNVLLDFVPRLFGVLVFVAVALLLVRSVTGLIARILKRSKIDSTLHRFILGVLKNSLRVVIAIAALLMLQFPASPLITLIGSVGLALSLALKDSLANMAGGVAILFNRPFSKGDCIEVKGVVGTVKAIDLVYTVVLTENGDVVYLPNGDVSKSIVVNRGAKKEGSGE